ncbi:MAG: 4-(cytidine 5'-diphospho)-2-C-methyl-D-erythritol kinase [Bacillota bacterium]
MNFQRVDVQTHAKINLTLDVLGKRQDGYHNIRSIMQSISLNDRVSLTKTQGGISVECTHPEVPCGSSNLAFRAAQELKETAGVNYGVHIRLFKNIPVAAGLGGGSADAAAVLRGLNRLWNTGFDTNKLREIGRRIGADVPFCLTGGTVLAEGIGEELMPLKPINRIWMVLFKPPFGVSTAEIYKAHDRVKRKYPQSTEALLVEMEQGNIDTMVAAMGNALEETTAGLYPEVADIISRLKARGVQKTFMCGSGPTVCAIAASQEAAERLKKEYTGFNGKIFIAYTVPRAQVFLKRERKKGGEGWKKRSLHL